MSERQSVPDSVEKFDRLKTILRTMFQLDRGELDFGLYRLMNLKAGEITQFLDTELGPQVRAVLAGMSASRQADLSKELEQARQQAKGLGVDPDTTPAVRELQRRYANTKADADAEAEVYNHLATFFGRYYDEGDFMSLRRYSGGGRPTYLIPYDGEEVKLHWANADQYYVKSTENYASYVFTLAADAGTRRVRFEIVRADTEQDDVKASRGRQRRFVLAEGAEAVGVDTGELVVRFAHRPLTASEKRASPAGSRQQDRLNEAARERILKAVPVDWLRPLASPAPTEGQPERTVLDKHLAVYTARNSFDYFIHKDLGGFLRRELDLYLKTEVLDLDDLAISQGDGGDPVRLGRALGRLRAVRQVADTLITFLAQIEDFQKQLWLKKKCVLDTHYCVTLDRVPEAFYPEIAANAAQQTEWVRLFAIDRLGAELNSPGYTTPLSVGFLKANPFLVLDTRHFDRALIDRLLAALSDAGPLDEQMDGLLVHGENFQALNLLQTRYQGQVQCVYIDPPYNTDASAILYKNDYKDSSWLSLMTDRLTLARECLRHDGILCVAIDDEEVSLLRLIMRSLFPRELGIVPVRSNPAGRKSRGQFSPTHEYALFSGNAGAVPGTLDKTDNELARYPLVDENGRYAWTNLVRSGSGDRRQDRPTMFYPIYVRTNDALRVPAMKWDADKQAYKILEGTRKDEVAIWPITAVDGNPVEKRWHRGPDRITALPSDYRVRRDEKVGGGENGIKIDFKARMDTNSMPKTWWDDRKYASANLGAKAMKDIFREKDFDFAKAVGLVEDCLRASLCGSRSVVLDFFAGSGTTGHAVINLNREDNGRRRYILVEVGHHFDTVLLPRMKKVVYAPDWKDGRPVAPAGVSQLFKYLRLESYEDTLDSLELTPRSDEQDALLIATPALAEDYLLRYALGEETAASPCLLGTPFADPFAYTLSVVRDGVRRKVPVDLPETFTLLLGLRISAHRRLDGVLTVTGTAAEGHRCLILWRNLNQTDNASLSDWFTRHRPAFAEPFDLLYVNGDHTLNALRQPDDTWTAETIEPVFRELMFANARTM